MKKAILTTLIISAIASAANAQTIGVSMSDLDKFRTALLNGVLSHGQAISGLKLVTQNAKSDNELQKKQVEQFIADKVDAIILAVSDGDLGPQMTKLAADAHIPLIYINNVPSNLSDLPENQVVVASNEAESGTCD